MLHYHLRRTTSSLNVVKVVANSWFPLRLNWRRNWQNSRRMDLKIWTYWQIMTRHWQRLSSWMEVMLTLRSRLSYGMRVRPSLHSRSPLPCLENTSQLKGTPPYMWERRESTWMTGGILTWLSLFHVDLRARTLLRCLSVVSYFSGRESAN